jgi:cell division initiation protein
MARLTPRDIQEKEFNSGFRGYKEEDVDEFLDRVTASYEEIFKENIDLKEEVDHLVEENKKYELIGERMQAALVAAQETADDVRKNATKEAENILREAEIKAHKLVQASRDQHRELQKSLAVVKQVEEEFRFKLKSTLQSYLKLLDEVALGDNKEIKKWILPEDMSVLDERRREMESREPSREAVAKRPETPVMAAETGIPGDVSDMMIEEKPAEPAKIDVAEAPKEEPKVAADDTAAMEAPAKPEGRKAEKEEAKKAEEAELAAKAEEAKAKAAALMEEIAQQAAEADKEEAAKAAPAKAEAPKDMKAEEPAPETAKQEAPKAEFDADNAKASAVTPEWAKLQEAVAEAVKEAEKPKAAKAEEKKPETKVEAKTETKAAVDNAAAPKEQTPSGDAKPEAKSGKTNLDDIEIVEDESFWKDI